MNYTNNNSESVNYSNLSQTHTTNLNKKKMMPFGQYKRINSNLVRVYLRIYNFPQNHFLLAIQSPTNPNHHIVLKYTSFPTPEELKIAVKTKQRIFDNSDRSQFVMAKAFSNNPEVFNNQKPIPEHLDFTAVVDDGLKALDLATEKV